MNSMTPVTIERTSKSVKAAQAIGWLAFFTGVYCLFGREPNAAAVLLLFSIPYLLTMRIVRWWVNG